MASFTHQIITDAGMAIINGALQGQIISISSIKTGNGTYTGTENLKAMTTLKSVKQSFGVSGITRQNDTTVIVRGEMNNKGVTAGYAINEIGIYVTNPTTQAEVLLCILVAGNPDYFAAYDDAPNSITLETYITLNNIANVTFEAHIVDGTFVTVQDFEDYKDQEDIVHSKITGNVEDVFSTTATYAIGDYCIYDNILYKFIAVKAAGVWDASKVTKVKLASLIKGINSYLNDVVEGIITAASGFTITSQSLKKKNGFVEGTIIISNVSAMTGGSPYVLCNLPVDFFLPSLAKFVVITTNGGVGGYGSVQTTGAIQFLPNQNISAGGSIRIGLSYGLF